MGYIEWTLAQVGLHHAFEWLAEGPADWRSRTEDWPPTRYEAKAIAAAASPPTCGSAVGKIRLIPAFPWRATRSIARVPRVWGDQRMDRGCEA